MQMERTPINRPYRLPALIAAGLSAAVTVVYACSTGVISGTVYRVVTVSGTEVVTPCGDDSDDQHPMIHVQASDDTDDCLAAAYNDASGAYMLPGLVAGLKRLHASDWRGAYYQEAPDPKEIAFPEATNVTGADIRMLAVPPDLDASVVGIDKQSGTLTGGSRHVLVDVTHQSWACHRARRLVVWSHSTAADSTVKSTIIFDSGESNTSFDHSDYQQDSSLVDDDTVLTPTPYGKNYTYHLAIPWPTQRILNDTYTLSAALWTNDVHRDGTNLSPDPAGHEWVHKQGVIPTGPTDAGTPGGDTFTITVRNLVILDYTAVTTAVPGNEKDVIAFDPDGPDPTFLVEVDHWDTDSVYTDLALRVWLTETAWGDTRPSADDDPYAWLDLAGPGIYTVVWDGSMNPDDAVPDIQPCGTYSFDIDALADSKAGYREDDHFYAKTHDGWEDHYKVRIGTHGFWLQGDPDSATTSIDFGTQYQFIADADAPAPAHVDMVLMDDLTKIASGTHNDPAIAETHTTSDLHNVTSEQDALGNWRVLITGETSSGASSRRDGTNARILAVNWYRPLVLSVWQPDPFLREDRYWPNRPNEESPGGFLTDGQVEEVRICAMRQSVESTLTLTIPAGLNAWGNDTKTALITTEGAVEIPSPRVDTKVNVVTWTVPAETSSRQFFDVTFYVEELAASGTALEAKLTIPSKSTPVDTDKIIYRPPPTIDITQVPTYLFCTAKYWVPITFTVSSGTKLEHIETLEATLHYTDKNDADQTIDIPSLRPYAVELDSEGSGNYEVYIDTATHLGGFTNADKAVCTDAYFVLKGTIPVTTYPDNGTACTIDPVAESATTDPQAKIGKLVDTTVYALDIQDSDDKVDITRATVPAAFQSVSPKQRWEAVEFHSSWDVWSPYAGGVTEFRRVSRSFSGTNGDPARPYWDAPLVPQWSTDERNMITQVVTEGVATANEYDTATFTADENWSVTVEGVSALHSKVYLKQWESTKTDPVLGVHCLDNVFVGRNAGLRDAVYVFISYGGKDVSCLGTAKAMDINKNSGRGRMKWCNMECVALAKCEVPPPNALIGATLNACWALGGTAGPAFGLASAIYDLVSSANTSGDSKAISTIGLYSMVSASNKLEDTQFSSLSTDMEQLGNVGSINNDGTKSSAVPTILLQQDFESHPVGNMFSMFVELNCAAQLESREDGNPFPPAMETWSRAIVKAGNEDTLEIRLYEQHQ
jgi:hypothetical protein